MSKNYVKKMGLTGKVLIGMLLGMMTGFLIQVFVGNLDAATGELTGFQSFTNDIMVNGIFHVVGQVFIASLKMLVVPIVFVSLICGVCSLSEPAQLGRLGGKSITLYILTTALAITTAISLAVIFQPGTGIELASSSTFTPGPAPAITDVIINMVPTNPIQAMAEANMLQLIVFALLFGVAMAMSGESGQRLITVFNDLNTAILKLVTILMNLAPYGVFALMAKLFANIGFDTILGLIKYFVIVLLALAIHALVTYRLLFVFFTKLKSKYLFAKIKDVAVFGFSTASSAATLPVTLETIRYKLGVHNSVASFTAPLGTTLNMDGTAMMQGIATVFIAQVYGVDLSITDYITVVLTATLASIGTAAVPGVGLIMLALVLQQVGLPVEGIALIIGVDRLLDMARTAVNIIGDCAISCIVAKSEGKLNEEVYNDPKAGLDKEEIHLTDFRKIDD